MPLVLSDSKSTSPFKSILQPLFPFYTGPYAHSRLLPAWFALSLSLSFFLTSFLCGAIFVNTKIAPPVTAATLPIADIAAGKVISINGRQFVKIGTDLVKGSRFMAVTPACLNGYVMVKGTCIASEATMQGWTGCTSLARPAATGFTQGPILIDARDGKSYEIRKFADNKCWMADNLMYGGPSDNCAGVDAAGYTDASYGGANGMASPSNRFGTNTYGNCRDPRVGAATSSPCYNSTACGYYYNWQAALQLPTAYYNTNVSYPHGVPTTTNFYQGICPLGWHLPSGGDTTSTSEFAQLDIANGGTGGLQNPCITASCNFWRPGYAYKSVYSGYANNDGSLGDQGVWFGVWSMNEATMATYTTTYAFCLSVYSNYLYAGSGCSRKYYGDSARCIKD